MTTRIHIARIPAVSLGIDDQALQLLASVTPAAPVWQVNDLAEAARLAEYVDLVDAGVGARDATYRSARQALERFVRRNWQQAPCRAQCGRSAFMSEVVDRLLSDGAVDEMVAVKTHKVA